jgi:hypothetical protein
MRASAVTALRVACALSTMWGFPFSDSLSWCSIGGWLTAKKRSVGEVKRGTHLSAQGIRFSDV